MALADVALIVAVMAYKYGRYLKAQGLARGVLVSETWAGKESREPGLVELTYRARCRHNENTEEDFQ